MPTDSVLIFPPGFRVTNANGTPVSGAKIKFYNAGTLVTRTVYSDSGLSSSLGATVFCGSDGYPVASSGSSTPVNIYTGSGVYKVVITTSADVTIQTLDNRTGALDTSSFLTTGSTSTLSIPVTTKTGNYTLVAADRGKLVQGNASGGNFSLSLDAAATLGDGWNAETRNSGSSGQVMLAASEAIAFEGGSFTARALEIGEAMSIRCDGTAFKVVAHTPPLMASRGPGVIVITDRVTSAPVSPTPGARYIVQTGFSTYATHDIIEANSVSFNKYTPPTDCGWIAYVQDEDTYYSFQGSAWVSTKSSQSEAETGSSTVPFMTPLTTRQAMPARAYAEYTTNASLTATIPKDDTMPQSGEGTEILTAAITLKNATNRVRVRFSGPSWTGTDDISAIIAALFINSDANALAVTYIHESGDSAADHEWPLVIDFEHAPGSVGPHTYKIRAGPTSGSMRFNGNGSGRLFGGAARTVLVLEEVFA